MHFSDILANIRILPNFQPHTAYNKPPPSVSVNIRAATRPIRHQFSGILTICETHRL